MNDEKPVLVLCKEKNEEKVHHIFQEAFAPYLKKLELNSHESLGYGTPVGREYYLYVWDIAEYFDDIDDTYFGFLRKLVDEYNLYNLEKTGLLLGYFGSGNHFWTDPAAGFPDKED